MDGERGVEGNLKAEGGQCPGSRPLGLSTFAANRREMETPAWALSNDQRGKCTVRGAVPPSPFRREQSAGASFPHAQNRPLPHSGGRRWLARGPCHPSDARRPQPGPRAPAPPHLHSCPLLTPLIPLSG